MISGLPFQPLVRQRLAQLLRPASPAAPGGPTTLGQRDIYILPTRAGIVFAVVLLAMLLGSMNYNNNIGLLLTFLLVSLAIVSILHTYRNLAGLTIVGVRAAPVYAGQNALFRIEVKNEGRLERSSLRFELNGGSHQTIDVAPGTSRTATLSRPAPHRGRLTLGRVRLESRFPLGLFRAWCYLEPDGVCIVYPRPGPVQPLPAGAGQGGEHSADEARGVEDFQGFRVYQPGDSPRHIDWKGLAREQELRVKLFSASRSEVLWLEWEQTLGGDTETRLSQLCRWVLDASRLGQPYGVRLPERTLCPAVGEEHLRQSLTALALFGDTR
ncbi:MAG: DUF58 domain-containing protein [Gammaproteobacteria bacterium]